MSSAASGPNTANRTARLRTIMYLSTKLLLQLLCVWGLMLTATATGDIAGPQLPAITGSDVAPNTYIISLPALTSTQDPALQRYVFDCPSTFCSCFVLPMSTSVYLNCTGASLAKKSDAETFLRSIPTSRSEILTLTCDLQSGTEVRSYMYDRMLSHLVALQQLEFVNCRFQEIPRDTFYGLVGLKSLRIDGANFVGQIDPNFLDPLTQLQFLEITNSNVTRLPPLCTASSLRRLKVSYNNVSDLEHVGVKCLDAPLNRLEVIDLSFNKLTTIPSWLGDGAPGLTVLLSGYNMVSRVGSDLCQKLSSLYRIDLSVNSLLHPNDVSISQCSKLSDLNLGWNKLGYLPARFFDSMLSLQSLYLNGLGLNDTVWDVIYPLSNLETLDLSNNALATVLPFTMHQLSRLTFLNLSSNAISVLPKKAFLQQHHLLQLDLSFNELSTLPFQAFSNLLSLQELLLLENQIKEIDQSTFTGLRSLKVLDLSRNQLFSIPEKTFIPLSNLQFLSLKGNVLKSISNDMFYRMDALVKISLAENYLQTVPSMSSLVNLSEVDLGNNNLTSLPASMFTGLRNLKNVYLDNNRLTQLSQKTFSDCVNLYYIELAHNSIETFSYAHFQNMQNLKIINLNYNYLDTIASVFRTTKLEILSLRKNRLQRINRGDIPATVEVLDLSENQITQISPFAFTGLTALGHVNLSFNELATLSANAMETSFLFRDNSKPSFFLEGNPLRCDCELGWLKDWSLGRLPGSVVPLPLFKDLDKLQCHSTFPGSNMSSVFTQTERNSFLCIYLEKCGEGCVCCAFDSCFCNSICPKKCRCFIGDTRFNMNKIDCSSADLTSLPRGLPESATEILLDGNGIKTLQSFSFLGHGQVLNLRLNNSDIRTIENDTFRGLLSLKELYLNENLLDVIYNVTFKDLNKLEALYLQDNEIGFIEEGAFSHMKNLKVLNLERNQLKWIFLQDFSSMPDLTSLRLRDNLWTCSANFTCELFEFVANYSVIKDLKQIFCYQYNNTFTSVGVLPNAVPILSVPKDMCADNVTEYINVTRDVIQNLNAEQNLSVLIAVSLLSALIIASFIVVYLNRQLLQVWCFTRFGWRVFKMASGNEDKDRPYDAFISYSHSDESFVVQELAPRLENGYKHFKLCLHYRDFPVGASIAETIVRSVESSKRAIILVSNSFLDSEWCKFEFQTAHQQVLTERKNRVIMILLDDIDESKLDQTLKLYMRTRTYLKYDDPWFWEKLMFSMPDKKAEKFERLPSSRDLEYMARVGHIPRQTTTATTSTTTTATITPVPKQPINGYDTAVTNMFQNDAYEVPVASDCSYEQMNGSLSISSSLYNTSVSAGSGHYEEVTPKHISMQAMGINCNGVSSKPPPLPPLPKKGLLSHEAVKNSRETLSKEGNWV